LKDITITLPVSRLQKLRHVVDRISFREVFFISLALHLFVISFPRDATVFDEAYYTVAGRDLLNGVASNLEHPFLGKAWGAIGIALLGDSWFGWRIPSVIFGLLTLVVFYLLAKRFLGERNATYASALLAFDNIFFIHSSLYLLEVPALFFSILGIYLYFKRAYRFSAIAWAAAVLSKETSMFLLFGLILYHIFKHAKPFFKERRDIKLSMRKIILFFVVLILAFSIPIWVYDASYHPHESKVVLIPTVVVDQEGSIISTTTKTSTSIISSIDNPVQHIQYMVKYASGLTIKPDSTVDQNNYALNWVLPLPLKELIYYDVGISKNITKSVDGKIISSQVITTHPIHWVGLGNIPLWIIGFWLVTSGTIYFIVRKRYSEAEPLTLLWILGTYAPLLAMSYLLGRIVYPFYFINTVPALALALPLILDKISGEKYKNSVKLLFLLAVLIWFFWFFPVRVTAV